LLADGGDGTLLPVAATDRSDQLHELAMVRFNERS
jgi:hypothetical protein